MGQFRGDDHTAAGADADDLSGLFQQVNSGFDFPGIHHFYRLLDGFLGKTADFHAAAFQSIGIGVAVQQETCIGSGHMARHFQLEGIEALQGKTPAEPGYCGFGHIAFVCQLGDGHELHLCVLGQHIVGNLPLCGGELIIGGVDPF